MPQICLHIIKYLNFNLKHIEKRRKRRRRRRGRHRE
jgi:predicted house-cleaning noncanonical NTP pyrophosphatase (MazG superfamily)